MRREIAGAVLFLALLPATGLAQDSTSTPQSPARAEAREKVRAACAADIQKFCANIERGKGAKRACLDQNHANLSSECNAARAERAALRAKEKS
jgi:hypothetical protein